MHATLKTHWKLRSLIVAVLLAFIAGPAFAQTPSDSPDEEPPEGVSVEWTGLELENTGNPSSGLPNHPHIMGLLQATLDADLGFVPRVFNGPFVLKVVSGETCHRLDSLPSDTTVTAVVSDPAAPVPADCQGARTDCAGPDGCTLAQGDIVYLTAGSTLTRTGNSTSLFNNPSSNTPAVLLFADFVSQPGVGGGCQGGCF